MKPVCQNKKSTFFCRQPHINPIHHNLLGEKYFVLVNVAHLFMGTKRRYATSSKWPRVPQNGKNFFTALANRYQSWFFLGYSRTRVRLMFKVIEGPWNTFLVFWFLSQRKPSKKGFTCTWGRKVELMLLKTLLSSRLISLLPKICSPITAHSEPIS
jgi:hypothetical protein